MCLKPLEFQVRAMVALKDVETNVRRENSSPSRYDVHVLFDSEDLRAFWSRSPRPGFLYEDHAAVPVTTTRSVFMLHGGHPNG